MSETLRLTIKSSIFDRTRQLTISRDYIEFDDRSSIGLEPTKFVKNEICEFRYGVKFIDGYQFTIGRIYCIDIRNNEKKTIKIRLKSIYGIRKLILAQKFSQIVNALLDFYFDDIARNLLKRFESGQSFEILGVGFQSEGVRLSKEYELIHWGDLGTRTYARYYALYSHSNPNHYKAFEYLEHWNTATLYSVSRQILKEKGLWSDQ